MLLLASFYSDSLVYIWSAMYMSYCLVIGKLIEMWITAYLGFARNLQQMRLTMVELN